MEEIWKDIEGYEGKYQVSNMGRVRSHNLGKRDGWHILNPNADQNGYQHVSIYNMDGKRKTMAVHRLVAVSFVDGYQEGLVVNHKDQNPSNNSFNNLEWTTIQANNIYGDANERRRHRCSKYIQQIDFDGKVVATYINSRIAHEATGISRTNIVLCCCGHRKEAGGYYWKHIETPIKKQKQKTKSKRVRHLPCEVWRDVAGYEGHYMVSNMGRIKSLKPNRRINPLLHTQARKGVRRPVILRKDGKKEYFKIYQIVAHAFCEGYAPGKFVKHKDGNVNNNRADNLEWYDRNS